MASKTCPNCGAKLSMNGSCAKCGWKPGKSGGSKKAPPKKKKMPPMRGDSY